MIFNKVQSNYVSEIDRFLNDFDKDHPELSRSQLKEKVKFKRIYALRDQPNSPEQKTLPEWF